MRHPVPRAAAIASGIFACSNPAGPSSDLAHIMLGEWNYLGAVTSPDPSLNAGALVSIVIDSAAATDFRGSISRWFAGDVGVPTKLFGPVTGAVGENGSVWV